MVSSHTWPFPNPAYGCGIPVHNAEHVDRWNPVNRYPRSILQSDRKVNNNQATEDDDFDYDDALSAQTRPAGGLARAGQQAQMGIRDTGKVRLR